MFLRTLLRRTIWIIKPKKIYYSDHQIWCIDSKLCSIMWKVEKKHLLEKTCSNDVSIGLSLENRQNVKRISLNKIHKLEIQI